MPRATRYLLDGYIYHLTHRCVDGEFFLQFAKERDDYREWLRIGAVRYDVPVLAYCVTSNHVHVVVEARDRYAVADMMKLASGAVAQSWNRRKERDGSVWEHPYQCTKVQDGRHLLNCLRYVDMNMVRAGKVTHPEEWRWCSYDELTGQRKRYRIVNRDRLLDLTGFRTMAEFSEFHVARVEERLATGPQGRESWWTEAIAVGDHAFVEEAARALSHRRSFERDACCSVDGEKVWLVKEPRESYTTDSDAESVI